MHFFKRRDFELNLSDRDNILKDFCKNFFLGLIFIFGVLSLVGCGEPEEKKVSQYLIKTPLKIITSLDFLEELELKKAAYSYNIDENPAEYNEMVIDLVKMLSEEIILLSAAADKGIIVSDQDVDLAEDEFKKDFPEDSFEQILLKNAISYSLWKKRFRKSMIIDKLIDQELRQKIQITSQDIVEFYKTYSSDDKTGEKTKNQTEKDLVKRLRLQKTQDHYDQWIHELGNDYPVEINKEHLKTFLINIAHSKGNENATDKTRKN